MFQTAMSIFGSGYVWLVLGPNSVLRVLASYNAGSPFDIPIRKGGDDPNSLWGMDVSTGPQQPGAQGAKSKQEYLIMPLLGLNVWEHAYVPDYGCSEEGKQQYLKNWWATINWQRVYDAQGRRTVRPAGAPRLY
jgi:Fe-Mn family superoxide dismutase